MISRDLGMDINTIRESSWSDLLTRPRHTKRAFRPKNMFLVSGNINLAQNRIMGMHAVNIRNNYRKGIHEIKCLLKRMKRTSVLYH